MTVVLGHNSIGPCQINTVGVEWRSDTAIARLACNGTGAGTVADIAWWPGEKKILSYKQALNMMELASCENSQRTLIKRSSEFRKLK